LGARLIGSRPVSSTRRKRACDLFAQIASQSATRTASQCSTTHAARLGADGATCRAAEGRRPFTFFRRHSSTSRTADGTANHLSATSTYLLAYGCTGSAASRSTDGGLNRAVAGNRDWRQKNAAQNDDC
jgi:hypothetical protein